MQCRRCRAENRPGRRFCAVCGAELARCPACGFTNESEDRFCGGCGEPLIVTTPSPAVGRSDDAASLLPQTPPYLAERIRSLGR
jgi:hypothetical protein